MIDFFKHKIAKRQLQNAIKKQVRREKKLELAALLNCDTQKINRVRDDRYTRVHNQLRREVYGE